MLRRSLLLGSTAFVPLAACQTASSSGLLDVVDKVTTFVSGIANTVLPWIAGALGIPSSVVTTINDVIAKLKNLATQVAAVATMDVAKPLIQQITDYAGLLFNLLGGLNLPAVVSTVIGAARVVLPILLALAGFVAAAPRAADADASWAVLRKAAGR